MPTKKEIPPIPKQFQNSQNSKTHHMRELLEFFWKEPGISQNGDSCLGMSHGVVNRALPDNSKIPESLATRKTMRGEDFTLQVLVEGWSNVKMKYCQQCRLWHVPGLHNMGCDGVA